MRNRRRPGYTLLEILLALAIAVLLLAAVYTFVGYQLKQAQAGRDLVEQTTLARALLDRMGSDVLSTIALGTPSRFRDQQEAAAGGSAASTTTAGGGAAAGTTTGGMTSNATGGATGAAASDPAAAAMTTDMAAAAAAAAVVLPQGVIGSDSELHLFVSKFPGEVYAGA